MAKCIDTSLWVPYLVPEPLQPQARALIIPWLSGGELLVAPAFTWAEVGSVLRKKVRLGTRFFPCETSLTCNYKG